MKILAFAGSNSSESINHQLILYVEKLINEVETEIMRLTDYNIPLYGMDIEKNEGIPKGVIDLNNKIQEAKGIIISVAEHNGNLTAFFKNVIDWLSRYNRTFLEGKKILLLSTSPGQRGGASALEITQKVLSRFKGEIVAYYSLGNFNKVFKDGEIIDDESKGKLKQNIKLFIEELSIT
jgi:NAD(P)H-dependent FMN reductase